jgi:hypothetical protein
MSSVKLLPRRIKLRLSLTLLRLPGSLESCNITRPQGLPLTRHVSDIFQSSHLARVVLRLRLLGSLSRREAELLLSLTGKQARALDPKVVARLSTQRQQILSARGRTKS